MIQYSNWFEKFFFFLRFTISKKSGFVFFYIILFKDYFDIKCEQIIRAIK